MKYLFKQFNKNTILDFLIIMFLSHIFYRFTFIGTLQNEFSLISQIKNNNVTSKSFFVESPTFTLIGLLLGIENIDIYKILIYLVSIICFCLIVLNIQFLDKFSTLFLFGGWLVTCSWFVGYVDIISVVLMVLISKNCIENNIGFINTGMYFLLLSINHNAISLAVSIIYLVLIKKENIKKLLLVVFGSQILGNIIVQFYLNYIDFSGRGRLRFVFNDNVIEDATRFVGENIFVVLWSGFLGVSIVMLFVFNSINWVEIKMILISLFIALFFTSIALDTSRVFSILVIPIMIYTLDLFNKNINFHNKLSLTYSIVALSHFFIGVYYFYGSSLTSSPHNEVETFYDFIARMVNSVMSNIWN
tara:strand:- start:1717 stop:2796 length:1080 start_codon:yes stop_codon:yes gene_type:complete